MGTHQRQEAAQESGRILRGRKLVARLQEEGKETFDASWKDLLDTIASEGEKLVASK